MRPSTLDTIEDYPPKTRGNQDATIKWPIHLGSNLVGYHKRIQILLFITSFHQNKEAKFCADPSADPVDPLRNQTGGSHWFLVSTHVWWVSSQQFCCFTLNVHPFSLRTIWVWVKSEAPEGNPDFTRCLPSGKLIFAIENGHTNSEFSPKQMWCSVVMLNHQRVICYQLINIYI